MSAPYAGTAQEKLLHTQVADFTLKVARPLVWHDEREPWPKRLWGGTCCILRFDTGLLGVTAEYVITAFETAKRTSASVISLPKVSVAARL